MAQAPPSDEAAPWQDMYPDSEDYTKWIEKDVASYLAYLNEEFSDYKKTIEENKITGESFHKLANLQFVMTTLAIYRRDALAISAAVTQRLQKFTEWKKKNGGGSIHHPKEGTEEDLDLDLGFLEDNNLDDLDDMVAAPAAPAQPAMVIPPMPASGVAGAAPAYGYDMSGSMVGIDHGHPNPQQQPPLSNNNNMPYQPPQPGYRPPSGPQPPPQQQQQQQNQPPPMEMGGGYAPPMQSAAHGAPQPYMPPSHPHPPPQPYQAPQQPAYGPGPAYAPPQGPHAPAQQATPMGPALGASVTAEQLQALLMSNPEVLQAALSNLAQSGAGNLSHFAGVQPPSQLSPSDQPGGEGMGEQKGEETADSTSYKYIVDQPGAVPGAAVAAAAAAPGSLDMEEKNQPGQGLGHIPKPKPEDSGPQPVDLSRLSPPPPLPYVGHEKPSLKDMSNKFRPKGPNRILYPPKNGPYAIARNLNIDPDSMPAGDPQDKITQERRTNYARNYRHELGKLASMGYVDQDQQIRALMRHEGLLDPVIDELNVCNKFESIYIGDRVVRGADWKWGDQDGNAGMEGTVRGLTQWHPKDSKDQLTCAIVLWDIGLYGNYRFGYCGAYDARVIGRDAQLQLTPITVGDHIKRSKPNWRWADQDGGNQCKGTVIELYASPAPFEGGARVAVIWDKDRKKWADTALEYERKLQQRKIEVGGDEEKEKTKFDIAPNSTPEQIWKAAAEMPFDPHRTEFPKRPPSEKDKMFGDNEAETTWEEPDFEYVLSRPLPRYRWGVGGGDIPNYDLTLDTKVALDDDQYLMIDDRVRKGPDFTKPDSGDFSSPYGIVLKVEQWDAKRTDPNRIRGDKVYTTWSTKHGFRFDFMGYNDVVFYRRGQVFGGQWARIRVGDRVVRGYTWCYGDEDGGHEEKGTVVGLQYSLQVAGILAKVRWQRNDHTNMYSWGFKDVYDLEVCPPGS